MSLGAGGFWQVSRWNNNLDKATKAWRVAGDDFGDLRLNCLAFAILAPNPHNLQPWLIKLDGTDRLSLYCSPDRLLPATDPPSRQITIGFGAFLELLRMAAADKGYRLSLDAFPKGEPYTALDKRPIANVQFIKDSKVKPDPLFKFALKRQTLRVNYTDKPVSQETLAQLNQTSLFSNARQGGFTSTKDKADAAFLEKNSLEGWHIELNTKHTYAESIKWTRVGARQVEQNPDGISLYGLPMEALRITGVLTPETSADENSFAFKATEDFYSNLIKSAQAWGWIWTNTNSRQDQLAAGRAWLRLHLQATKLGLGMHPLSQVLQEFPEMAKPYKEIHRWANLKSPKTIQGLFRFGYAPRVAQAPRWALKTRVLG